MDISLGFGRALHLPHHTVDILHPQILKMTKKCVIPWLAGARGRGASSSPPISPDLKFFRAILCGGDMSPYPRGFVGPMSLTKPLVDEVIALLQLPQPDFQFLG